MNWLIFALWFSNVVFDTIGQLAFKKAASLPDEEDETTGFKAYWRALFRKPILWVGILAYLCEFFLWLAFLTLVPLSEGILLGSINIIVIMVFGRIFFNEKLTPMRVIGISLVAIGVAIVGAF